MSPDPGSHQLLVDVLNAMLSYRHEFPPELVGRVLLAVGPQMMAAQQHTAESAYCASYPPPPADERITTWPGRW